MLAETWAAFDKAGGCGSPAEANACSLHRLEGVKLRSRKGLDSRCIPEARAELGKQGVDGCAGRELVASIRRRPSFRRCRNARS